MVRTTVFGAGLVDLVGWGLAEEELVGVGEGLAVVEEVGCWFGLLDGLLLGLPVGFGLVGADLSGRGVGAGLAVVNRVATSPDVSTGIDAGVTALPTISTAIQPLTIATRANATQRAAVPARDLGMPPVCALLVAARDTGAATLRTWLTYW